MNMEVFEVVTRNIAKVACKDQYDILPQDDLYKMHGLDSLDKLEVLQQLEEYYRRSFGDNEFMACTTAGDIVALIELALA